ncbi:fibronectin type III-like domain-contianing protein [Pengzhenrongella sp.]|uniref:fibronectin type III-like domain-contianing protein n=1 Tax=Pengzhenrongella sp. TaxID=2888820 RepID=UPI002F932594
MVRYGEGVFIGYRWYDAVGLAVRYPFGHGLSYTSFEYADLRIDDVDRDAGVVQLSLTVRNTGTRTGAEVVQVYVGDSHSVVRRPLRELRAFEKVTLAAGEQVRVRIELSNRDFAYYDVVAGAWRRQGGEFRIEVGASSRDLRLEATVELPDDDRIPALVPDDELADIVRRGSVAHRE